MNPAARIEMAEGNQDDAKISRRNLLKVSAGLAAGALWLDAILGIATARLTRAADTGEQTAPQGIDTSAEFQVANPFAEFYQSHGGEAVIGAPISKLIEDGPRFVPGGGKTQFFEKFVLVTNDDYSSKIPGRTNNRGKPGIYPMPLGFMYYQANASDVGDEDRRDKATGFERAITTAEIPNPNDQLTILFKESGHRVSGEFLKYLQQFGGNVQRAVELFGLPITEARMKSGILVQHFVNTRLELEDNGQIQTPAYGIWEMGKEITSLNRAVGRRDRSNFK